MGRESYRAPQKMPSMSTLVDVMELNEGNVTKCNAGPNPTFYLLAEVDEKVEVVAMRLSDGKWVFSTEKDYLLAAKALD